MLKAHNFEVNEAWIAVRVNKNDFLVENEPYTIHALIDAASCYVLGFTLSPVASGAPEQSDVDVLFKKAWAAKKEWAKKLIIEEGSVAEFVFRKQAKQNGLTVEIRPQSDLIPIIGDLIKSFASDFSFNKSAT